MSHDKLKEDPAHKEQFIQDYLAASEYADDAIAAADKESVKKAFGGIKDNLVALFINSGTADCESLQGIYGPKVETNQTDLNYLKKVISIMKMMKCTDSDAYQQASFYVYKIEPSAEAATGCAYQAYKKGDIDGSVKFFDDQPRDRQCKESRKGLCCCQCFDYCQEIVSGKILCSESNQLQ